MSPDPQLTLCATARLAQACQRQPSGEAGVWVAARALTPGQWLQTWAELCLLDGQLDVPRRLDSLSEGMLWEQAILAVAERQPGLEAGLFDLSGMAATAAEANALLTDWGGHWRPDDGLLSEETRLFLRWRQAFERRCATSNWLEDARWRWAMLERFRRGQVVGLDLPARVRLLGYDRLPPFEQALGEALVAKGVSVEVCAHTDADAAHLQGVALADLAAECRAVAAWVAARLRHQPGARLGIVVPDLAGVRRPLELALEDAVHPEYLRPDAAARQRCFNISLGQGLAARPVVAQALEWLALARGERALQERFSALLRAPYWAAADQEADALARLDASMRATLPGLTSLPALLRLATRRAAEMPMPERCLAALAELLAAAEAWGGKRRLPSDWGALFGQVLVRLDWPGRRPLNSVDYQACQAFHAVLGGLAQWDAVLGPVRVGEALRRLGQACRARLFQPETRGTPPVQVLGVLESAGLQFDALWVMGMNDHVWPPMPRPNPLLPANWQRARGTPHASAAVELAFARQVHARLRTAAPEVVFSWSRMDGVRPLRPSPLLAGVPCVAGAPQPDLPRLTTQLAARAATACVLLEDHQAPPVAPGERVSGGTWVLRAQAICPAWAFYQYRLGAEALKKPVEGLDPAGRGSLVHGALEVFWKGVRTSSALQALDAAGLDARIAQAVAAALEDFEAARRLTLPPRFRQLEAQRLARLLQVWLALERQRSVPFEVVACEQEAVVDIEGLRVRMFVDRIDALPDGQRVVVDYKTGQSIDTRNWASDRLTEPQLPIYAAIAAPEGVVAVSFAKVLIDTPSFAGVAANSGLLPGVPGLGDAKQKIFSETRFPDWAAVVAHWHATLHAVARELRQGEAGVWFRDAGDLAYCDVRPILRLAERASLQAQQQAGVVNADRG